MMDECSENKNKNKKTKESKGFAAKMDGGYYKADET